VILLQNEQMRLDDVLGTSGDAVAAPKAAAAARLEVLKKEIAYHNKQYYFRSPQCLLRFRNKQMQYRLCLLRHLLLQRLLRNRNNRTHRYQWLLRY
jgi:hypothetical protein